jgi:S1-C subfamily serine protease
MKKDLLLILATFSFLAFGFKECSGKMSPEVVNARNLTVLISNEGFDGSGRGTGILLDSTHVLTCAHMFREWTDNLFVYTYPLGQVVGSTVEASSQQLDLAILVLDSSVPIAGEPVFQDKVEEGDAVTVIGNALGGMHWFVSHGIISGTDHGFLLTDALVNPGNSGGPWINDKGEVVALTDWRIGPNDATHVPGLVGGVSGTNINRFLRVYKIRKAMEGLVQ